MTSRGLFLVSSNTFREEISLVLPWGISLLQKGFTLLHSGIFCKLTYKISKVSLSPNFRFLEKQRKIRRKKTLHFVSSFMISTKTKEVIFFPTFRLKSQLISICFSGFSRFVALCNCSNPSYSLLSYGAKFIIGS